MPKPEAAAHPKPYAPITEPDIPVISTRDFLGGYINDADPVTIPINGLVTAKNVDYIRNMLFRRNGLQAYSITKPNSSKVLNLYAYKSTTSGLCIFRFDKGKIYKATSTGWVDQTPNAIGAVSGSDLDYFSFTTADDRAFFSNNGVDAIRELTPGTNQYQALGNAPKYRYITSAFDRIIGLNRMTATADPTEIGWSARLVYNEWDPLVNITAGSTPLVDSPSDTSDEITGGFSIGNTLVVPRQRSIWFGVHTNSSTNPFAFSAALPRVGADTPRTITLSRQGLIFFNAQDLAVYLWDLSQNDPIDLAEGKIRRYIKQLLSTAYEVWAGFSRETKTYTLFFTNNATSVVTALVYNLITKTWNTIEIDNTPSCVADLDFSSATITINDLVGTINALLGTIDALGGLVANSTRFVGFTGGEIRTQPFYSGMSFEVANIAVTDDGTSFATEVTTKMLEADIDDVHINLVKFNYTPYSTGTLNLYYTTDSGKTWILAKTETVDSTMLNESQLLQIKKSLKSRKFQWKVTTSNCMFALNGFAIRATASGVSQ